FGADSERRRLIGLFAAEGVAAERIELLDHTPTMAAHLAAYGRIDIALDPLPYSGTTTTADALWMGVPVLTLAGESMVERMSATLLASVGLSDWIAADADSYVDRARRFSADPAALADLRHRQRAMMAASPILDADGLAAALNDAFRAMW